MEEERYSWERGQMYRMGRMERAREPRACAGHCETGVRRQHLRAGAGARAGHSRIAGAQSVHVPAA